MSRRLIPRTELIAKQYLVYSGPSWDRQCLNASSAQNRKANSRTHVTPHDKLFCRWFGNWEWSIMMNTRPIRRHKCTSTSFDCACIAVCSPWEMTRCAWVAKRSELHGCEMHEHEIRCPYTVESAEIFRLLIRWIFEVYQTSCDFS